MYLRYDNVNPTKWGVNLDEIERRKCLDDIRLHKVRTKKLRILIANTVDADVKKHLTKGLIWHIKSKRKLKQMLIDDIEEHWSASFKKL